MNQQAMNNQPLNDKPIEILLAEDSHADARLTAEALKETRLAHNLNRVSDGVEALEFLDRKGRYAAAPRPDLILLDLNMPRKDGREVLEEIALREDLKTIPVVILTTSEAEADILQAFDLKVKCYVIKAANLDQFTQVVKSIEDFWLTLVAQGQRA